MELSERELDLIGYLVDRYWWCGRSPLTTTRGAELLLLVDRLGLNILSATRRGMEDEQWN